MQTKPQRALESLLIRPMGWTQLEEIEADVLRRCAADQQYTAIADTIGWIRNKKYTPRQVKQIEESAIAKVKAYEADQVKRAHLRALWRRVKVVYGPDHPMHIKNRLKRADERLVSEGIKTIGKLQDKGLMRKMPGFHEQA